MTLPGEQTATRRRIPPPAGHRQPLKVNIFERMQQANTELVPLFPYYGSGAFIPCGALFRGDPDVDMGQFMHHNTVDEVVCVFGGKGALLNTGQVLATPKLHGVSTFLRDPADRDAFLVLVITQHQTDGTQQSERVIFRCNRCHTPLLEEDFGSVPGDDASSDGLPDFPTIVGSAAGAARLNADEAARTCPKCGEVNPPFPLGAWGWAKWVSHHRTVNDARRELVATAAAELGGS